MEQLFFDQLDSTNEEAKRIARAKKNEKCVIVADIQTQGKGRQGRTWWSNSLGGLYYTYFIKLKSKQLFYPKKLTRLTAEKVVEVIHEISKIKAEIEWPNDIIIDQKKAGGILIETLGQYQYVIIGIGLNINQKDFPKELKYEAISLAQKTGRQYDKKKFVQSLTKKIDEIFKEEKSERNTI